MGDDFELYVRLGLINDLVATLQGWPREMITEREVATALNQPVELIIKIFDTLGVTPPSWQYPELYNVSDLLAVATVHEWSQRANR